MLNTYPALAVSWYFRKSKQTQTWVCRGVILGKEEGVAIAHIVHSFGNIDCRGAKHRSKGIVLYVLCG